MTGKAGCVTKVIKVWSWRSAIQKSNLGSTTKLVLLNLSIYMNELGQGCFPSVKTQAMDTGLSEKSICTHIDKAAVAGYINKGHHGFSGQGWSRHEYVATYPEGTELGSTPLEKALNVVPEGTEPDDKKALNVVQSNSSINTTASTATAGIKNKDIKKGGKGDFCEDWDDEVLPFEWQEYAENLFIKNDTLFKSWVKFKQVSDWPLQFTRWKAWLSREGKAA